MSVPFVHLHVHSHFSFWEGTSGLDALVHQAASCGMKALALAAQSIKAGDAEVIVAGGIENMSAAPYYLPQARWGARMFNAELVDGMVHDGLWETFNNYHMGITAENIAEQYGITRAQQDELSMESQERALKAIADGIFKIEIVPVEVKVKKETVAFETPAVGTMFCCTARDALAFPDRFQQIDSATLLGQHPEELGQICLQGCEKGGITVIYSLS